MVAVLAMSAPPAAADINDDGFGFGDLVNLSDDFCDDFDLDAVCDDEEEESGVDIDTFSVGEFDCFAVTEEGDLENVFCAPEDGGELTEVV